MDADAYLPDGTPLYFRCGRGNGKPTLQLAIYAKLMGVSDEDLRDILKEENDG